MKRSTNRVAASLLALGLLATACGRSDEDGGDTTGPAVTNSGGEQVEAVATTDDCEDYAGTQGVTDEKILLGSSLPTGLPFNNIAEGARAYFAMRNAEDPIAEREVELLVEDDGYKETETKKNWDKLTAEEGVFATLLVVGTQGNKSFQADNNDECIPNIFAASGSEAWGQPGAFPWTIGSIPSYPTEAAVFAQYLKDNKPDAKVAILYQNDDFGKSYLNAFTAAVEGTGITVVGEEYYSADNPTNQKSQVTALKGTGADTLLLATTLFACSPALNEVALQDWDPLTYISATCASPTTMASARTEGSSEGTLSAVYLKAPDDPQWADDADMLVFKEKGQEYGLSAEQVGDGLCVFGWVAADLFAQAVEAAPSVDRAAVMNSLWSMDGFTSSLLLPGSVVTTSGEDDPFAIEAMSIAMDNGEIFELQGDLIDFSGETGTFVP